jgi:hypothetical protein
MLPMAAVMMVTAPNSARLPSGSVPSAWSRPGLATVVGRLLLMSFAAVDSGYALVVVPLVILAAGMGSSMAPATSAIMASLPLGKAGVGSAVNDTTRELGGRARRRRPRQPVGVGVRERSGAGDDGSAGRRGRARRDVAGRRRTLGREMGGAAGEGLVRAAQVAYVDGMATSLRVGGVGVLVASILVLKYLPSRVAHQAAPPADDDAALDAATVPSAR